MGLSENGVKNEFLGHFLPVQWISFRDNQNERMTCATFLTEMGGGWRRSPDWLLLSGEGGGGGANPPVIE
jgi:hypothetical protein